MILFFPVLIIIILVYTNAFAAQHYRDNSLRFSLVTLHQRLNAKTQFGTEKSLSDLEDEVEKQLDTLSEINPLQHTQKAPTKFQQSSQSYCAHESTFELEDEEALERQKIITKILEDDEQKWNEEMKRKILGRYADAKNDDEIKKLHKEEREEVEKENKLKKHIAHLSGVTLDILDKDYTIDEESNFKPLNVKGKASSWFQDMDFMNGSLIGDDAESPRVVNGRLISREGTQGIRVGSAGGWTLEIFPGDFVVHRKYGIGKFDKTVIKPKIKLSKQEMNAQTSRRNGIVKHMIQEKRNSSAIETTLSEFGTDVDRDPVSNPLQTVLEVSYSDAKVHIPVEKAYRLSRYRAGDAVVKPKLSRVKGEAWNKAKRKVEEDTIQMATDVLALYATRETLHRTPFEPSKEVKMRSFEKSFPFEPTPDQTKCFEEVENDMVWRSRPMDRLVCGDVGFGKTEVALRALFRCVSNGRQAALLSPTGVLAAQHLKTVLKRMGPDSGFDVEVAILRGGMGRNTKAGRVLREQIANGRVQLIVGTHALLSSGLKFKDLGLLVVDEEQRFGVKQKERLKLICNGIDVLTLSATPIPRTLQMSLSGVRDTSTIRSPPPMRKPTVSYVEEFNKNIVRDALSREFDRGGQCYYVVPRIAQLNEAEQIILDLFPDVRIIQAHGRQARGAAEENVAAFAEGKYDVLLATTVIENGVDIPSVNTIIINNAQAFGMSTLYQLRGRVGRSNLQGYAYFLHKTDSITEQSAMRLQAMADLHALGSGFDVANRDLEIRGAGSLLGTEQSGMAAKVGFDLYMRMLKKSIRKLRGLDLPMVPRTNVILPRGEGSLEVAHGSDGSITHAFQIPKEFIPNEIERIQEEGKARLAESTKQLVKITNEWKRNYGTLPQSLQTNLKMLHLHACTRTLGIDLVGLLRNKKGFEDCILRSPGLRLRHWMNIVQSLPKGVPTKGLDVVFPARLTRSLDDIVILGGQKLVNVGEINIDDEENDWDAYDEEEVEAMKEISSSIYVEKLIDADIEEYPRFIVKNMNEVAEGSRVEMLLKLLLPASKVIHEKQLADKEKARVAADLRDKRSLMKKQKKKQDIVTMRSQFL